jgi:hypothetical protein
MVALTGAAQDITWLADWNHAQTSGPCGIAYQCSDSEMVHMFYDNWAAGAATPLWTEPTTAALTLLGLAGLCIGLRRRQGQRPAVPQARRSIAKAGLALAGLMGMATAHAAAGDFVVHADWAESLARNVLPADNEYDNDPNILVWPGVNDGQKYQNRTVCGSFVTGNLKQAYGWTDAYFTQWTGGTGPDATKWHTLIATGNRFVRVFKPEQIARGDIIAAKYLPCAKAGSSSGHAMIALSPAIQRPVNSKPVIAGTVQYEVLVADSSGSDHDATGYPDTRIDALGNKLSEGAGVGWLRLYRNVQTGDIQGYTWSMKGGSTYYDVSSCRTLAVGRLQ